MAMGMGDRDGRAQDRGPRRPQGREPSDYRTVEGRSWPPVSAGEDLLRDHDGWSPGADAYDALVCPNPGLGPGGWRRSDARLRDRICEQLMEDKILDARGIEVRVEEGLVTLTGLVAHASDVRLAEMLTREAAPTAEVRNQLRWPQGR